MITQEPVSVKKILLWCIIGTSGIVTICLMFISVVSIWTGFTYMKQAGFWIPILGGTLLLFLVLFLFIRATKRILFHMKDEDVLFP